MRFFITSIVVALFISPTKPLRAQDLGPHFVKLKDGIFVYAKAAQSNCGIIVTQEGVVSAAVAAVKRFGFLRTVVTIENIKADIKRLRAFNPEIVVPAHGLPGTVQILDETDKFYDVLLERMRKMVQDGIPLDMIKKNLRMPEYDAWSGGKERLDTNIEAAYRAVKK
jgi:hypothetical protein